MTEHKLAEINKSELEKVINFCYCNIKNYRGEIKIIYLLNETYFKAQMFYFQSMQRYYSPNRNI